MGRTNLDRAIAQLTDEINTCLEHKTKLKDYVQRIKNKCLNNEITHFEYDIIINEKLDGKTITEWFKTYDDHINKSNKNIISLLRNTKQKRILSIIASFAFIALLIISIFFLRPIIIGFATQDLDQTFTQNINLEFNQTSEYEFTPNNLGQLISLKLSGIITGEGPVKIYLDDLLILDSTNLPSKEISKITGLAIEELPTSNSNEGKGEGDLGTSPSHTNSPFPSDDNSQDSNSTEVEGEGDTGTSPSHTDSPSTSDEKIVITKVFKNICKDTCNLKELKLNKKSYTLKIEISNAILDLNQIIYEITTSEEAQEVIINDTIIEEIIPEETKEQIINETIPVETPEVIINETIINKTIINETIINETTPTNITTPNITIPTNITLKPTNISKIDTTQIKRIVLGQKVIWTKKITLDEPGIIKVELPKEAKNITVNKINKGGKETISGTSPSRTVSPSPSNKKENQTAKFTITGNIILQDNKKSSIFNLFKKLTSTITGRAITTEISEDIIEITIEDNETEYEIIYETEAPQAFETLITETKKQIIISGPDDLNYTNILAFTNLPLEMNKGSFNLYHIVNGSRNLVTIDEYDFNDNGLIDFIEWNVPHLSNQTYELELTIITVQSFPMVGGNWSVSFQTSGIANLTITSFNGTTWSITNENEDLKFLELKCGTNILPYTWIDNGPLSSSVFVENFECNEVSLETSKVLTEGIHTIEFQFGGIKKYAYNTAGNLTLDIWGSINGYNSSVRLRTNSDANTGFDVYDATSSPPPLNYSEFYSTIVDGSTYKLAIDTWDEDTLPRTLNLSYFITSSQSGTMRFNWLSLAGTDFSGTFYYYEDDSTYTTLIDSKDMRTATSLSNSITSETTLYVQIIIDRLDETPPSVTSLTETPSDAATYSSGALYEFNATITDDNTISTVILTFDGKNFSTSISGSRYTASIGELSASGSAYSYTWYAADNLGNVNATESGTYTVNKASPSGSLSGTSPISVGTAGDVQGSESNAGDGDITYQLFRDGALVSNPDTSKLESGSYSYVYNTTGGTNYSADSSLDTFSLTVNQAVPQGSISGTSPITYPTAGDVQGSESNSGDGDVTYQLFRDGTLVSNPDTETLAAGTYDYIFNTTGGTNYSANSSIGAFTLTVNTAVPQGSISGTSPINYGTAGDVQGSESNSGDSDVTYQLFRDGALVSNPDTETLAAGTYNYIFNTTGGTNYSANSSIGAFTLTINQIGSEVKTTLNITRGNITISTGQSIDLNGTLITGDPGTILKMYQDEVLINSGTSIINNLTTFNTFQIENITVIYPNTENYTESSETWWVNVEEEVAPKVIINSPTAINYSTSTILFNATATDASGIDSCWVTINSGVTNQTLTKDGSTDYYNFTNSTVVDGSYTANFYCNDTLNQINDTESVIFSVDTTTPDIEIVIPATNNTNITDTTQSINYTYSETPVDCWYSNDSYSVNTTITCGTNITTLTWADGEHVVTIYINDSANNVNESSVTFTVDTSPPNFDEDVVNQSFASDKSVEYNFNATDATLTVDSYFIDDTTNFTIVYNTGVLTNNTQLNVGFYQINVSVNDTLNNINSTLFGINITTPPETIPPNVTINSPTQINYSTSTILFNTTTIDETAVDSCWVTIDNGISNNTLIKDGSTDYYNFTNTSIVDGSYTANYYCNDTLNNLNNTESVTFSVDTLAPDISIVLPTNDTNTTNTVLSINYTYSEGPVDCWYSNDSYAVNTTITCGTNITTLTWAEGVHVVTIYINDSLNHVNKSQVTFTVDTSPPYFNEDIINQTFVSNVTANYDFNATDDTLTIDTYFIDDTTNFTIVYDTGVLTNNTQLSDGVYQINVSVNDTLNNINSTLFSFNITAILDIIAPNVTINSPTTINYSTSSILFNATALDKTAVDSCWVTIDSGVSNQTLTKDGSTDYYNFTNSTVVDGSYTANFYCNDTLNNLNDTESVTFSVDTSIPRINFTMPPTPANGSSQTAGNIEINVSINESNLDEVIFNWNGTNYTLFNDSIILMMNFDNVSVLGENDTHVVDLSGSGNNGTAVGDVYVNTTDCVYGNCFTFGGNNDYIDLGNDESLNFSTGNFTVSLWFNARDVNDVDYIYSSGRGATGDSFWSIHLDSGLLKPIISNGTASAESAGYAMVANNWYHVVVVFELWNETILYVNGSYNHNDDISSISGDIVNNENDWLGGRLSNSNDFDGEIDDLIIWNYSLSAGEIEQLYFTNFHKYDEDNWALYVNRSLNNTDGLPEGDYTFYATALDDNGNFNATEERTVTIAANTAPDNPTVLINSTDDSNKTLQDLNCYATITDPNSGDTLNVTLQWFKNNSLNLTIDYNNSYANNSLFVATLNSTNTTKTDFWSCGIILHDGSLSSNFVNSTNLTILNTAPEIISVFNETISSISLTEGPFETNITLDFSVYDPDNDLDDSTSLANFTRSGQATRENTTCSNTNTAGEYTNYSCNISFYWFDEAGSWDIATSINDNEVQITNSTTSIDVESLTAYVLAPSALTWTNLAPNTYNQTSNNDPILMNNTGNTPITSPNIQINATNLRGETTSSEAIWAGNFSVSTFTGGSPAAECNTSAITMSKGVFTNITSASLTVGNFTLNDKTTAQEELYFCIDEIGPELSTQSYSTAIEGSWTIVITLVALTIRRKKRKIKGSLKESELETIIQVTNKVIKVPLKIFIKNLGALETVTKYLKENENLTYKKISELLKRDQRTIWTAYHKAQIKQPETFKIKSSKINININIFKTHRLTILETTIIYLKEQGKKYNEIAKLLNRDQRNIWTIYANASKKQIKKVELKKESLEDNIELEKINIPLNIFSKKIGALEIITKYLKENENLNDKQISKLLDRDQSTIWTAYHKALEKIPQKIKITKRTNSIPLNKLKNKNLTMLESLVMYLKDQGKKYSDIARILDRDQRNIWTIYANANKKIKSNNLITQ